MIIETSELSEKLERLLEELSNSENLVNPFFRISKGTPEQIRKYSFLNTKFLRASALIQFVIGLFAGTVMVICMVICSLILVRQYNLFRLQSRQRQVVFVSHGIGQNITNKNGDQFFWKIPEYLHNEGKKVSIIYTNHSIFGFRRNSKSIQLKSSDIERLLIPKFLHPSENLTYLKKISILSFKSFVLGISKIRKEPIDSALLLKATTQFLKREAYSNYLLSQRVTNIAAMNGIETIVLTFEGHSYEQLIIDKILKGSPKKRILLYQHSPIVKDHHGISAFLQRTNHILHIATTGIHYKEVFTKLYNKHFIEVLGSDKSNVNEISPILSETPNLLFVPEGTTYATKSMLNLVSRMIKEEMHYSYILRLHPNLKIGFTLFWRIKKLKLHKNVVVSTSKLHEDLALARYVIYRSSAVGIESLKSSAIPVFYGSKRYSGLNVLGHLDSNYPSLFSISDAIKFFKHPSIHIQSNHKDEIFNELFENMNYKKLNTFLNL
jgi:hypothetical protein